jgi:uncharacterized membrane protein
MRNKILTLFVLSALALIAITSFASAAISVSSLDSLNQFNDNTHTKSFTISNSDALAAVALTLASQTITDNNGKTATISFNESAVNIPASSQVTIQAYATVEDNFNVGVYTKAYVIQETGVATNNATLTINFDQTPSKYSDDGNLKVDIKDITVKEGFGEDNEWFPLDNISVEVTIENKGDERIKNIVIEWGLYNNDTQEWVVDGKENDFNLDEDEEETVTFQFKLDDPEDFKEDSAYTFYVWATGQDKEIDDAKTSVSTSEEITIKNDESDFVALDNIKIQESPAACGSEVTVTADIWNLGQDDQDDVSVLLSIPQLKLEQSAVIGGVDAFETKKLALSFVVPQDAEEKAYTLELSVRDEDNNVYQNDYNDDNARYTFPLEVKGASCSLSSKVAITANLESAAKSGSDLVVKTTIANTGSTTRAFTLSATDYDSWATLSSISPETITLAAGESKAVTYTLSINKGASGSQAFNAVLTAADGKAIVQPVSVTVEKTSQFNLGSITGNLISGDNWYLWGIGALNVILVLVIIFVSIRLLRKN